jgi:predicted RNA-binding protein with PUA-like domain
MKSEAHCFSYDDLVKAPKKTTYWDGVRNFEARNMMRDLMKPGDLVLFYHSNGSPPGVAGIAKIEREGYPDHTAFDRKHVHYDAKSDPDKPTWYMVDVQAVKKLKRFVPINELREHPMLKDMGLFKRNRLSITAVTAEEFDEVCNLGDGRKDS